MSNVNHEFVDLLEQRSPDGAARCTLTKLNKRYGQVTLDPASGDYFHSGMDGVTRWRVVSVAGTILLEQVG